MDTKSEIFWGKISSAETKLDALALSATTGNKHFARMDYIREIMGTRACSGYFVPTRANVNHKFIQAWTIAKFGA
jgi:hypothetical protein